MNRVLTAVFLLPVLWLIIKRAPASAFYGLVGLVMAIAAWECYALLEARGLRPMKSIGLCACLAVTASFLPGAWGLAPCLPLVVATVLAMTAAMARRSDPGEMLETSMSTLFPVLFVGLTFGYPVALRAMRGEDGTDLLLLLLVCVMGADTAAFYAGSYLGRRRLAPILSPKKSWEGALGGIAGSIGGGLVAHFWFYRRLPLGHALILGALLGTASIVGDLAESMVKRAAGAKDSSRLLPGHGGMLDRTDGLLFSCPLLYYYSVRFLGVAP